MSVSPSGPLVQDGYQSQDEITIRHLKRHKLLEAPTEQHSTSSHASTEETMMEDERNSTDEGSNLANVQCYDTDGLDETEELLGTGNLDEMQELLGDLFIGQAEAVEMEFNFEV